MILKFNIYIPIILFSMLTVSCVKDMNSRDMYTALSLTNRAINYSLKGENRMADFTYDRAIKKFRDMGLFCDMARVSINMYTTAPENDNFLKDGRGFAALGSCQNELNIINFLSNNEYNIDELEFPFKSYAKFKKTKKISQLKSIASSAGTSDRIKSSTYRTIASALISSNPDESIKYIAKAEKIDSKHGWTKNILQNQEIMLEAYKKLGKPTEIITERIKVLKQALGDKF